MTQVYEVFTKLSMVDGVSASLAVIAKEILRVEGSVTALQTRLTSLNKLSLAVAGGLAAVGGVAVLTAFKNIASHGDKLLDQQDKLQRAGMGLNDVLKMQADYYNRIARSVPTSTASEYLKTFNELRSVVGADKAADVTPWSLKLEAIIANATGKNAEGEGFKLWRAMEMTGRSISDPAGTQKLADAFAKNIIGSGGKLDANTYATMAKRGGVSYAHASPEFLAGAMSVVAADLGGDTAGTALQSLYQLTSGATKMSVSQMAELRKLGAIDPNKVHAIPGSSSVKVDPGAIFGSELARSNPYEWVQQVLMPRERALYGNNNDAIESSMAVIGRNRNVMRMLMMFSDAGFMEQIHKDTTQWSQAHSIDRSYNDFVARNPKGVRAAFDGQYESMMQAVGAPLMQAAIPVMKALTEMFTKIGSFANANPEAIKAIGQTMALIGVGLLGAGTLAIATSIGAILGPAGAVVVGLTTLAGALNLFSKINWPGFLEPFKGFGEALLKISGLAWSALVTGFKGLIDLLMVLPKIISECVTALGRLASSIGGLLSGAGSWIGGLFSKTGYGGGASFNGASVIRASTDPVANAAGMLGAHESINNADVQEYLRTGGVGMNPAKTAWCAAFVNASLAKAGVQGTGSLSALSFLHWGSAATGGAQRGDVFVKSTGGGHGHVGMLTGRFQNGLAEMISGNHGNRVGTSWENLRGGWLRRGFTPPTRGAAQGGHEQVVLNVDGETFGRIASKHIARHHEHTRQAPFFNGRGMFASNDVQFAVG